MQSNEEHPAEPDRADDWCDDAVDIALADDMRCILRVELPPELIDRVYDAARSSEKTMSEIVEGALNVWLPADATDGT